MFSGEPQDMAADGEFIIGVGVNRHYGLDLGGAEMPAREGEHDVAGRRSSTATGPEGVRTEEPFSRQPPPPRPKAEAGMARQKEYGHGG